MHHNDNDDNNNRGLSPHSVKWSSALFLGQAHTQPRWGGIHGGCVGIDQEVLIKVSHTHLPDCTRPLIRHYSYLALFTNLLRYKVALEPLYTFRFVFFGFELEF